MPIQELIAEAGERLTPSERRIAEMVLRDPSLLVFGTVSDLADRLGTSRPTVVRFAAKLGFSGFTELQRWARERVTASIATPGERIRRRPGKRERLQSEIEQSVHESLDTLDAATVRSAGTPLARAGAVWIVSGETSRAGAMVLQSGLSMVRDHVRLIDEHDLARDLSAVRQKDAAVVFDFARYRRASLRVAEALAEAGAAIIAITDGPLSPLARLADVRCDLRVPAVGPFDSSVPPVIASELIVQEVVQRLGVRARDRIDRLEALWNSTETFLPED